MGRRCLPSSGNTCRSAMQYAYQDMFFLAPTDWKCKPGRWKVQTSSKKRTEGLTPSGVLDVETMLCGERIQQSTYEPERVGRVSPYRTETDSKPTWGRLAIHLFAKKQIIVKNINAMHPSTCSGFAASIATDSCACTRSPRVVDSPERRLPPALAALAERCWKCSHNIPWRIVLYTQGDFAQI